MEIEDQLVKSERNSALCFLAAAINELTLVGRDAYDGENAESRLRSVNEAVHRMSGHLRDLCEVGEPLTKSRAQGIFAALDLLDKRALARVLSHSPV